MGPLFVVVVFPVAGVDRPAVVSRPAVVDRPVVALGLVRLFGLIGVPAAVVKSVVEWAPLASRLLPRALSRRVVSRRIALVPYLLL